jgi:hypothetical protein
MPSVLPCHAGPRPPRVASHSSALQHCAACVGCVCGVPSEPVALRPRRGVSIGGAGVHSLLPGSYLQRQARLTRGPHARVCTHTYAPSCRDKQKRARALTPTGITRAHISASVVLTQTHACMTRTRTRAPFDGVEVGAAVGAADRKKMAALHSASRRRCGRRQARPGAKVAGVNPAAPRAQHASPHPICRRSFEACRSLPPS